MQLHGPELQSWSALNSSFEEISIHLSDDGTRGFFLSNKTDTLDLYQFKIIDKTPQAVNPAASPIFISGLSQTFNPELSSSGDVEISPDSSSSQTTLDGPVDPVPSSTDDILLIIKFHVVDGYGQAVDEASLTLNNKFTGNEQTFKFDSNGLVEIQLDADQKFIINASKDGYQTTKLPISTMGASKLRRLFQILL